MGLEIERKFLVKSGAYKEQAFKREYIKQGFLNSDKKRVVRIRIMDDTGFLTVKGPSEDKGVSRFEWEKEIRLEEAQQLFELCEEGIIEKNRYLIKEGIHVFEVDEFFGENLGLVVAEVELTSKEEVYTSPEWLGEEVTGVAKYYNSNLSKNPYNNW